RRLFEHKRPPAMLVHREQIGKRASNIDAHAKGTIHTATKRIGAAPSRVQGADTFTLSSHLHQSRERQLQQLRNTLRIGVVGDTHWWSKAHHYRPCSRPAGAFGQHPTQSRERD